MTLFLRDKNNITLVDIDLYIKTEDDHKYVEISSTIDITTYSRFLLNTPEKFRAKVIMYFASLSELRGWMWEGIL